MSITDPMGKVTTRSLDSAGRLSILTNPLGQRTSYAYDALNHVTGITDAQNGLTQFSYDANGNLRSVTDARGSVTGYTPDNMDRVATRTDPLTRSESSTYDLAGNLATSTDRKGQPTSRTYDALDRLAQVTYADGSTTAYTWDAGNALTQITDSQSGTITRTYDSLDQLTQETTPQGAVSYAYDAAGRRTSMTVAGQPAVTYTYDNANRLLTITQGSTVVTIAYDVAGRRTSVALPNGVVTEYTYDAASRVTGLTYRKDTTTLGTLTYTYDAAGNRVQVGGTWARTALPPALAAANYDAANRPLTFGGQILASDLNGNLLNDGTSAYTWDARNRLAGITGAVPATFQYDAIGRRTRKTINGVTTDFVHDGINPVTESGPSGTGFLLAGLGVDDFLLRLGPGSTSMFLTDALGSLVATTDATGGVQSEVTYEPFGNTEISSPAPAYRFTGREHDEPLYLYYYRARYDHTDLQRFISEDPFTGRAGDWNAYVYAANRPLTFTDPLGLFNILVGASATAIGVTGVEGSAGAFVNFGGGTQQPDVGGFVYGGMGTGVDVGYGGMVGVVFGGTDAVAGVTANITVSVGPISVFALRRQWLGRLYNWRGAHRSRFRRIGNRWQDGHTDAQRGTRLYFR